MTHHNTYDFSPKAFLKKRRPEKFSDSITTERGSLDRPVLEHFLASLNTRSQELQFENFAKRLCEKIVCPNLLAQTGPVAGGDGKTDTQTFPVSEQIQMIWYEGINESSHKDKWAFAVSTRKDWKVKCREDVVKIEKTLRDYKKIFCVTNQYAKSNQRADLEEKLTKETGIEVHIFDISWILDQIYKNKLEFIAIEELSISVSFHREKIFGSNDYKKNQEYERIKKIIDEKINPSYIKPEEVDYFLDLAVLSAELEQSKNDTHALFGRAIKIAKKFGSPQQCLDAYYQYAWKAYFWLEDFDTFKENLILVYNEVIQTSNANKWEFFVTLIRVYKSHAHRHDENLLSEVNSFENEMIKHLSAIAADETRPSNALFAKAQYLIYQLQSISKLEESTEIFDDLFDILKSSTNLVGFPFDKIFNLINEIDFVFGENESYEKLLDFLTEESSSRNGEISGAELKLKRGIKKLNSGQYYQAIKLTGNSFELLYKEESAELFILALKVISSTYEQVGLLWGSRACMLFSASMLTDKYWKQDELNAHQVKVYNYLCWIELKLGRLGAALKWHELSMIVQNLLGEEVIDGDEIKKMDYFISHLILNSDFELIKDMKNLPSVLDSLGLFCSSGHLLFTLGYEDEFEKEFENKIDDDLIHFLIQLRDFDFGYTPLSLANVFGKRGAYTSRLSGCKVDIDFPNRPPFLEFSAGILSFLESVFATCIVDDIFLKEASLSLEIIAVDDDDLSVSHEIDTTSGKIKVEIICSGFDIISSTLSHQNILHDWFRDFVIHLIPEMCVINSLEALEKLLFKDGALTRSISLGTTIFACSNVLGKDAENQIKDLFLDHNDKKSYPMKRIVAWDKQYPKLEKIINTQEPQPGNGEIPFSIKKDESIRHTDVVIQSLIKPRLWDKAEWSGVGFFVYPADDIPGLGLLFKNSEAGRAVFTDLISEVGVIDTSERLRIVLIKGISSSHPCNYRVVISESMANLKGHTRMTMIARVNTMSPKTDLNIDRFITKYNEKNYFYFSCDSMVNKIHKGSTPQQVGILIKNLQVRWAWEIGMNDPDMIAIQANDTPLIPSDEQNPPVAALLEYIRNKDK
ncbi:hypothetical protein CUU54_06885 [Pectobacterium polaris]|uniref:hypothetical protein n=1 Tax=Pectobacterium polaris TaxID=2042057 RepID=UPI000D60FBB7|nr:hypothetical protein [Pectobacterium polaris]MCU1788584.1 hypothetical protein [Pectobacterium polaris]PWD57970.1 hypothetical protein DF209_13860 [Pectobacterium polaris]